MNHIRKPIINTERLVLKSLDDKDKSKMISLMENSEIAKTYMVPTFKIEEEKETFFYRIEAISKNLDRFVYGIFLSEELIGFLNEVEKKEDLIEVGYIIDPAYWNHGYMTEALKAAIKELYRIGYNTVKCAHFEENLASGRVMEKAGMKKTDIEEVVEYRKQKHRCIVYLISNSSKQ